MGIAMLDGMLKVGCATPEITVANPHENALAIEAQMREASALGIKLLVFPELCLTGYTCGDLFLQRSLQRASVIELLDLVERTQELSLIAIVGLPVAVHGRLYNCAAVFSGGKLYGLVPKQNIPNYSEFYEARHFCEGSPCVEKITLADGYPPVPLGGNQLFAVSAIPELLIGVELCEDMWVANSPSTALAEGGATVICNLSASDEVIGKADYRRSLLRAKSGSLRCAYLYADAGLGESTTDLIFAGHNLIAENGSLLAESPLFHNRMLCTEIDVQRLVTERQRVNVWHTREEPMLTHCIPLESCVTTLSRSISPNPFVPDNHGELDERCRDILEMQAVGLATRLTKIRCRTAVIGLSGGLDSTLALLVTIRAFDRLGLSHEGIHTITMPCYGTTGRTRSNACALAHVLGTSLQEIPIASSVAQHFCDIGHDPEVHDVTYENSQARERTQILMDLSNKLGGIVIGTGDLSELALGWATYNGDHMSMYAVNTSIPKTLVRYLVQYEAMRSDGELQAILLDILATPVSPELLPPNPDGSIAQKTEDFVGPYELHDFFLYYLLRFGFSPQKIYRLARYAFGNRYDGATIAKWERTFYSRFFSQQFKRSCLPDGPKVGTVTLSPRGDFRMPSDASVGVWMREIETMEEYL